MSFRGLKIRGARIEGSFFLEPPEVGTLNAWWKWKTGITLNSGRISLWNDQSVNAFHLSQINTLAQPGYDSASGRVTPDGINEYLECPFTLDRPNPEITIVVDMNGVSGNGNPIYSNETNTTPTDADSLRLITSQGFMYKDKLVGIGAQMTGTIVSNKYVASFAGKRGLFVNGTEVPYTTVNKTQDWNGSTPPRNLYFFAQARNVGGLPNTPFNFCNIPVLEMCMHNSILTDGQRNKMINYFKQKHSILT
jgi:hypothetical protein